MAACNGKVEHIALSADGTLLAADVNDIKGVLLFETGSGRRVRDLTAEDYIETIAWQPGTHHLAAAAGAQVIVWDADTGALDRRFGDRVKNAKTFKFEGTAGHTDWVASIAWSPDGKRLISGGADATARIWDVETGAEILVLKDLHGPVRCVGYTPDGGRVLITGGAFSVGLWDAVTGERIRLFYDSDHKVAALAVSPDGTVFATGGEDGTVKIWDLADGRLIHTWTGVNGPVTGVCFGPGPGRLAACSANGAIAVAGLQPDGRRWELFSVGSQGWFTVGDDGRWDGAGPGLECVQTVQANRIRPAAGRTQGLLKEVFE